MRYAALFRGIRAGVTKSPRLWRGYIGWWINANLSQLPGSEPRWLMRLLRSLPPRGYTVVSAERMYVVRDGGHWSWWSARFHCWWFGWWSKWPKAIGRSLRSREWANRGHRCDWTDPEDGILYGGQGTFMNDCFDALLKEIEPTEEQKRHVKEAVDELTNRLAEHGHEIN